MHKDSKICSSKEFSALTKTENFPSLKLSHTQNFIFWFTRTVVFILFKSCVHLTNGKYKLYTLDYKKKANYYWKKHCFFVLSALINK